MKKKIFIFVYFSLLLLPLIKAQNLTKESRSDIEKYLSAIVKSEVYAAPVKIDSSFIKDKKLKIYVNPSLSYISFTDSIVAAIYKQIKTYLPPQFDKYKLELYTDSYTIDEYIPFNRGDRFTSKTGKPLVSNISRPFLAKKGLANRHLALWQSHGWYYEQKLARWEWQRARVFQTVEDLYTQSYVLPYLVPMLENAGANVLLPRERDTQSHEIIVDNDNNTGQSIYRETNGKEKWNTGNGLGFNKYKDIYMDGDNPYIYLYIYGLSPSIYISLYLWMEIIHLKTEHTGRYNQLKMKMRQVPANGYPTYLRKESMLYMSHIRR